MTPPLNSSSPQPTAGDYLRRYAAFIAKAVLVGSLVLAVSELALPPFSVIVALFTSLYIFIAVYWSLIIQPRITQDVVFWVANAAFVFISIVVLRGICMLVPGSFAACQPRTPDVQLFFKLYWAVVIFGFWIIARAIMFLRGLTEDRKSKQ